MQPLEKAQETFLLRRGRGRSQKFPGMLHHYLPIFGTRSAVSRVAAAYYRVSSSSMEPRMVAQVAIEVSCRTLSD